MKDLSEGKSFGETVGNNKSRNKSRSVTKRAVARKQASKHPAISGVLEETPESIFDKLRSGAANVAGVTFQVAISAYLLAVSRAGTEIGLNIASVRPEGLEDIDCAMVDRSEMLVQVKERGPNARAIAMAELAEIITHAAPALLTLNSQATNGVPRFAVVTNGRFGSGLSHTGSSVCLTPIIHEN